MDPFIGEIRLFGFLYAPQGWAFCDGSLLSIAQNQALFALIGTTYGGNGTTNFALPDLRGRVPNGQGKTPGLSNYAIGQAGGEEMHTLTAPEMPAHNHGVAANQNSDSVTPNNSFPANDSRGTPLNIYATTSDGTKMNPGMILPAGSSQAHNNIQPYLTINFCIALNGIFPPRT